MKRILVCGGRDFDDWALLLGWLDRALPQFGHVHVVQGGAKGADFLARVWAKYRAQTMEEHPADWKAFGPAAGNLRNQAMLDVGVPDLVIAFPGGRGTADMVRRSRYAGVETFEVQPNV